MRKVAIVGVGTLPWRSRYEDKVWFALGLQAAKNALHNAGLTKDDIDAAVYSIAIDVLIRQQIPCLRLHEYLGLGPKPGIRALAGGATDMAALYTAFSEVALGMSDVVLCLSLQKGGDLYCSETRSRGDGLLRAMSFAFDTVWLSR